MAFAPLVVYGIMAAGTALAAYSAVKSGQQQKQAADYNAAEEKNQANVAADTAGSNAIAQQRSDRMQLGNAAALLAQSGQGFGGTGSAALRQSAVNAELNTENIQYGGTQNYVAGQNQATLSELQGQNAQSNGYLSAAGQLFSGAGSIYRYANNPAIASANGG